MQTIARTFSHRSIHHVTKEIIKDVIGDINGNPDYLLVAFTNNYREKQKYQQAISKICEESGTQNIMGGTFPGVATSEDLPTTQGCSVMAIKSNEIDIKTPFSFSNVRTNPQKGAKIFGDLFELDEKKSEMGFFLTPGPFYQQNAFEQLKILDTFFARKFKKIFNLIGDIIDKNMGKNGYGSTLFADIVLKKLAQRGVKSLLGGATIDLDMKSCYQFSGDKIFRNALVGTAFSSDNLHFGHSWAFDKSQRSKDFGITDFLKSGYIQSINEKPANETFLEIIGISEDLYEEAFKKFAYASLLYLSAIEYEEEHIPFVSVCHPILDGVITTIPERITSSNNIKADFFTQSGTGIQKSASECATNISKNLRDIRFGIFINCSNRLLIAGDKIEEENKMIKKSIGDDVPFITLYSGGEFSLINQRPVYSSVSVHGFVVGERKNVVF